MSSKRGACRLGRELNHFTASDGATIAYRDSGPESARPLVLLHGLMAHGGFFASQDALAGAFRLVVPDLRGHGGSVRTSASCTVERAAADIAELVEALALENAVGVGWSLGATILWHVLDGPAGDRFAGAVVVDMTARVRNGSDWALGLTAEACEARAAAMQEDFEGFAAGAGRAIFAQPIADAHREAADWASREFARNEPAAMSTLWSSLENQDVRPLLRRIRQPHLVVHGAQSSLYGGETADHLVAALSDARAVRFDHSGHAPHLEEPARFNRIVSEFAASLPPVRPVSPIHASGRM